MDSDIPPPRNGPGDSAVTALREEVRALTSEVRELRRKLTVLEQVERLRDVVMLRYPTRPWAQPTRIRLAARDAAMVEGLYYVETSESGIAYRWTGPDHVTRFRFNVDRRAPLCVRLGLLSPGRNSDQVPLTVEVEGATFALLPADGSDMLQSGPLPPRDDQEPTELLLHVPVLHCPQDHGFNDTRRLGVAITSIALDPVA